MDRLLHRVTKVFEDKTEFVSVLFFCLLFVGLLLGDGKQGVIEVYSSSVVLVCWACYVFYALPVRSIDKRLLFPWLALGFSALFSTFWSYSIGFSISWFVRFFCGYAIYRLFYSLASKKILRSFLVCSSIFVFGTTLLWIFSAASPWFREMLPSMNLIDLRHGHSHLADLLVFLAPVVMYILRLNKASSIVWRLSIVAGYVIALILTLARGAWLVVIIYALLKRIGKANDEGKGAFYKVIGYVLGCALVATASIYIVRTPALNKPVGAFFRPLTIESRLEYWRQAAAEIRERPLLGSGPGTFSLVSQERQRKANASSWFAHSFPIQLFSEIGFVGFLSLLWLVYVHTQLWRKKYAGDEDGVASSLLIDGLTLVFIYGAFEFVLDHQVLWLLFWGGVGLLSGMKAAHTAPEGKTFDITISYVFICIFYLLWISSTVTALVFRRYDVSYYIAPFDAGNAIVAISDPSSGGNRSLIETTTRAFHDKSPAITLAVGQQYERMGLWDKAEAYYKKASYLSPNDPEYYGAYFKYLSQRRRPEVIGKEILALSERALPQKYHAQLQALTPYTYMFGEYYMNWMAKESPVYIHGYAGLFYRLGISDLRDVEPMEKLLILARDIYPDLGALHIELAAFYYHIQHNERKTKEALLYCQQFSSAADECKKQFSFPLYQPAEYIHVIW